MIYSDGITDSEELMLINQMNQKSVTFVTIGFAGKILSFKRDFLLMSINLCNITIFNINRVYYCCITSRIS